jgi:hypothetical protein
MSVAGRLIVYARHQAPQLRAPDTSCMATLVAPLVTVLMPVRNGAAHLEMAASSILRQSLEALELLVVDDGSTDATPSILARLAAADRRVRVLRQGAEGLVAALNRGLREAKAPLVARMDADDIAAPYRLERQMAAMDSGVALAGSAWRVIGPGGVVRRVVQPPLTDAEIRAAQRRANVIGHPTVMLRRDAVLDLGGYRPAFLHAEDYDLWLRLLGRHRAMCLPEVLLDYREHPGQSAWRNLEQRILSEMGALAAHACRESGLPDGGEGDAPIDRARLRQMGMTEEAIRAGVIGRALGSAKNARAAGFPAAMRAAAQLGLRQPGLQVRTRVHFLLLGAQAAIAPVVSSGRGFRLPLRGRESRRQPPAM